MFIQEFAEENNIIDFDVPNVKEEKIPHSKEFKDLKKIRKDELVLRLIELEKFRRSQESFFQNEIERLSGRPKPPPLIASCALGLLMPIFSIFFAGIAGTLITYDVWIPALFLIFAGIAGLWVSLSHVTEAIVAMTGSAKSSSMLLAFALEVGIVGLEMTNVMGMDIIPHKLTYSIMGLLGFVVAMGNIIAFARHRRNLLHEENNDYRY